MRPTEAIDDFAPIGLLEGLATTRSIRRYRDEPVSDEQLATICWAATRAPTGSNRQNFRLVVLRDGDLATKAKALIAEGARTLWADKRAADRYDSGSGVRSDSPKARLAASMEHYVDHLHEVPVLVLPCLIRHRAPHSNEGASVYPAVQNLLLAARAIGLGGVLTQFHGLVDAELHELLAIPDEVVIAATVTLGVPAGSHGPVRRRPLGEFVFDGRWGDSPEWAVDPAGTRFTQAGPPSR